MVVADGEDIDNEFHNAARGEVLPEAAPEKRIHKGFKSAAFAVEVGFTQIHVLQIADNGAYPLGGEADIVFKYFGIFQTAFFVEGIDAFE